MALPPRVYGRVRRAADVALHTQPMPQSKVMVALCAPPAKTMVGIPCALLGSSLTVMLALVSPPASVPFITDIVHPVGGVLLPFMVACQVSAT